MKIEGRTSAADAATTLAGVAEWRLNQAHLPLPGWITSERGNRD